MKKNEFFFFLGFQLCLDSYFKNASWLKLYPFSKRGFFSLFPSWLSNQEHLSSTLNFTLFLLWSTLYMFFFLFKEFKSSLVFRRVAITPGGITCCVIGIRPLFSVVATYQRKVASLIAVTFFYCIFFQVEVPFQLLLTHICNNFRKSNILHDTSAFWESKFPVSQSNMFEIPSSVTVWHILLTF